VYVHIADLLLMLDTFGNDQAREELEALLDFKSRQDEPRAEGRAGPRDEGLMP